MIRNNRIHVNCKVDHCFPIMSSNGFISKIVTRITRRVPHVEQELLTLSEHLSSPPPPPGFQCGSCYLIFNVICVVFCRPLFVLFPLIIVLCVRRFTDSDYSFNFKIINFPNMCSNIPASPAYGVYISQLIRYARASSNYSDFLKRHLHLRNRLLDQGYKKIRLIRSLKKFIFRYQDLVKICSVSAEKIISDAFSYSENV